MSSTPNSTRQYPVICPTCTELKGYPYQVRTVTDHPGEIEVKLRCRDCGHEWVELFTSSE